MLFAFIPSRLPEDASGRPPLRCPRLRRRERHPPRLCKHTKLPPRACPGPLLLQGFQALANSSCTSFPRIFLMASCLLITRPAPWQVDPQVASIAVCWSQPAGTNNLPISPGTKHRLPNLPVLPGYIRIAGSEGARGSFSVHAELRGCAVYPNAPRSSPCYGDVIHLVKSELVSFPPITLSKLSRTQCTIACLFAQAKFPAHVIAPR